MAATYPVRLEGRPDAELSQWLWLVKWFLVIPHLIVLAFLWTAFWVLTVFAFFAILIMGRYPRSVFDFNVGVMRWSWRVAFYAYGALGTDRYPPFSLGEEPDYPATLHVDYPERLSRGLVLVKSWLLAIPHYLVIGFFLGGAGFLGWRWAGGVLLGGSGLIAVLVLIGAVILLFTGKFPRGIQDFALGMDRWVVRVGAYATLMTDEYPPFRLDSGPVEPEESTVEETAHRPAGAMGSAGRVTAVVLGALATLVGLGLTAGGGVLVWADQNLKDPAGYIQTSTQHYDTAAQVLRFDDVDLRGIPHWMLGDVRVRTTSDRPIFAGIGHSGDVARYLTGAWYDRVGMTPRMYRQGWMSPRLAPPDQQQFWYASTTGAGTRQLDWNVQSGQWTVVVLNTDTSAGVDVDISFGATAPGLYPVGLTLLGTGVVVITGGVLLQYLGLRRRTKA